jgi:hypothetical protein
VFNKEKKWVTEEVYVEDTQEVISVALIPSPKILFNLDGEEVDSTTIRRMISDCRGVFSSQEESDGSL